MQGSGIFMKSILKSALLLFSFLLMLQGCKPPSKPVCLYGTKAVHAQKIAHKNQ